jgi:hypothetical protein
MLPQVVGYATLAAHPQPSRKGIRQRAQPAVRGGTATRQCNRVSAGPPRRRNANAKAYHSVGLVKGRRPARARRQSPAVCLPVVLQRPHQGLQLWAAVRRSDHYQRSRNAQGRLAECHELRSRSGIGVGGQNDHQPPHHARQDPAAEASANRRRRRDRSIDPERAELVTGVDRLRDLTDSVADLEEKLATSSVARAAEGRDSVTLCGSNLLRNGGYLSTSTGPRMPPNFPTIISARLTTSSAAVQRHRLRVLERDARFSTRDCRAPPVAVGD